MTTESKPGTRNGLSPLVGAMVSGLVAIIALVVAAAAAGDRAAVVGAATGGVVTLSVFALGIAVVGLVARLMPAASLLVALMTYTLQLLALALVVTVLERSGLAGAELSRGWFAAAVVVVTILWLVGQLVAATRQRIPVYDDSTADELVDHPGGER